ncbi:unnamed protein product [Brachionus calyciflorus]|uniref:UPAR/Ly6 domain-containing protein n=1 Tax=Brachionus calyciflorus TaxID=104777 RepID=A0A814AUT8_9BILA|nr:unnamed protein product [Brachionus calyciflorus]
MKVPNCLRLLFLILTQSYYIVYALQCVSCPTNANGECFSEENNNNHSLFTECPETYKFCSIVTVFVPETNKTLIVRGCQYNCTSDSYISNNLTFNTFCCVTNLCNVFPNERFNADIVELNLPVSVTPYLTTQNALESPKQTIMNETKNYLSNSNSKLSSIENSKLFFKFFIIFYFFKSFL